MIVYKRCKCNKCNKIFDLEENDNILKCTTCGDDLTYLYDYEVGEQEDKICKDVHSIKNMILFFTILTVLNLIASFIMLMAR
jgi:PHP family Zn ribbon phosphoesterase